MRRILILVSALQIFSVSAFSAELRGTITDDTNGQPVRGALVRVTDLNLETSSDVQGQYVLRDLTVGTHVVSVTREGYAPYSFEEKISDANRSYGRNVVLKSSAGESGAEAPRYRLPEVQVLTTRASVESPVTFTNVSQKEIERQSYGQDLPLLLSELPNVSTYSEGGAGMGYSYLRMRGFPQDRVAVQINGVPLNDAETSEVFWVDLPDFQQDLADMQVQRGVGSSLYGPAAFGGSINMVTRIPGLGDRPMIRAEGTYGTWNTQRAMVQFQSGRIQNRYGISGRITRMQTDGYRFNSWAKLWSYYLSGARFTPHHTTRLIFYGGPEQTHLAYEGVPKDSLNNERSRRYNPFQFPGETDNFFQPHYELHDDWTVNQHVAVNNSVYLFKGDGYYDQWRTGENAAQYYFHAPGADSISMDVLQRRNITELDGGWIPRLNFEHRYGTTIVGGEVRLHQARHEGIVQWSSYVPSGFSADYNYYDYRIRKNSVSGFVHNLFRVTDRLHALADLQMESQQINLDNDKLWGVTYDKSYSSVNPRVGLNYQVLTLRPAATVYANLSLAQHEPKPADIYFPEDYAGLPIHDSTGTYFQPKPGGGYEYIGPAILPEKMTDVELGTMWQWPMLAIGANLYWMRLHDEIIPYGTLNNLGQYVSNNANETVHQGVEVQASLTPLHDLTLAGNAAVTDHHFVKYSQYGANLDGKRIAFDPQYVVNGHVSYTLYGVSATIGIRSVGKQYVDNTQTDSSAVKAYTLLSFDLGYRFTRVPGASAVDVKLRVNNVLNSEYEAFGYVGDDGFPRYIVGAPRAMYVTLGVEL